MYRRKRRNRTRKRKVIVLTAVVLGSIMCVGALPFIAKTVFGLSQKIDFSSEPEMYAGEYGFDYFNITGGETVGVSKTENAAVSDDSSQNNTSSEDTGPEPYPTNWNEDEDTTVYPYTFERYSGDKFIALEKGGQVMNETEISNSELLSESKQSPDFEISLDGTPQVLIMHTHTTECYEPYEREHFDKSFNYRTSNPAKSVVAVGNEITAQLEDAGIGVIHDATIHDYPTYNGSYERSAETVKGILAENPTIKVVLDIHRDAIGSGDSLMQPTIVENGKKAAQIMIISGCDDGTLDMPDYMKNFHFACALQQQFATDHPGLARPILFDYRHYNQDLTTGSLLIEVGSHGNTIEQAVYSGKLIGRSLVKVLKAAESKGE